jgi:hypothetical protein
MEKGKHKESKNKYSEEAFIKQIFTSAKEQNCPTICNTETKHQQILRRKADKI